MTLVNLPSRTGWKAESKGSALCRTLCTCGTSRQIRLEALLAAYWRRNLENSESVESEGWTEMISSEERYAMRATVVLRQCYIFYASLRSSLQTRSVDNGGAQWQHIPASPAVNIDAMSLLLLFSSTILLDPFRGRNNCYCILLSLQSGLRGKVQNHITNARAFVGSSAYPHSFHFSNSKHFCFPLARNFLPPPIGWNNNIST